MTRLSKVLSGLFVAFVGCLLTVSQADAKSVNVDFNTTAATAGTYASTGAAPDTGTTWNAITAGLSSFTSGTLVDSNNVATTVTISILDTHAQYDTTNDIGPGTHTATFASALLDDYAYNTGTYTDTANSNIASTRFTIGGLTSGAAYDLYLYAQNGGYYSQTTTFRVNGVSQTVNNSANLVAIQSGFIAGGNYTSYLGVVATGGSISGTFYGTNGTFDGFQLVIPEPASMTLLASTGLLLLRRRKRRMA